MNAAELIADLNDQLIQLDQELAGVLARVQGVKDAQAAPYTPDNAEPSQALTMLNLFDAVRGLVGQRAIVEKHKHLIDEYSERVAQQAELTALRSDIASIEARIMNFARDSRRALSLVIQPAHNTEGRVRELHSGLKTVGISDQALDRIRAAAVERGQHAAGKTPAPEQQTA